VEVDVQEAVDTLTAGLKPAKERPTVRGEVDMEEHTMECDALLVVLQQRVGELSGGAVALNDEISSRYAESMVTFCDNSEQPDDGCWEAVWDAVCERLNMRPLFWILPVIHDGGLDPEHPTASSYKFFRLNHNT
jgi:hypothetical protein